MGVVDGVVRSEGTGDGLDPVTAGHTPMVIAHRPPGIVWIRPTLNPLTSNTVPLRMVVYLTGYQTAKSRGTNGAL